MLNLDAFTKGRNQPALDHLPTLNEVGEDEASASVESYGSEEFASDYGDSESMPTSSHESTTEMSTGRRSDITGVTESGAKKGVTRLCWLRGFVLGTLFLATFLLATVVNHIATTTEVEHFEAGFAGLSLEIFDSFSRNIEYCIGQIDSFANTMPEPVDADGIKMTWPFVTVPGFEVRAKGSLSLANAAFMSVTPIVQDSLKAEWNSFVLSSPDAWLGSNPNVTEVNDARFLQAAPNGGDMEAMLQDFFKNYGKPSAATVDYTMGVAQELYRMDGVHKVVDNQTGYAYPVYQHYPITNELVNFNLFSHQDFQEDLAYMTGSENIIIGRMVDLSSKSNPFHVLQDHEVQKGPASVIYYPLVDSSSQSKQLVGLLATMFRWSDYLQTAHLVENADGAVAVLSNTCDQKCTFRVVDGVITYVGKGDFHNINYDELEQTFELDSFLKGLGPKLAYGEREVQAGSCSYTLHVYPSLETADNYTSSKPMTYTVLVIATLVIATLFFIWYDTSVAETHRVLARKAIRSQQIISSLFPSNVRERLFGDNKSDQGDPDYAEHHPSVSQPLHQPLMTEKVRLKNFLHAGEEDDDKLNKPIADLFAECTVLFADIAGFTAWSSVREPAQVFLLLESVYNTFDKIAVKRRVFKVETIGDCYVAVTGLPDKQPNHVTIMVRFARECLEKFKHVTRKLEVELGPETGELGMRFGIHSGPVTAGVLRGQRARFQLFGDTVNTAARMESTGKANKIQCSHTTANQLMDTGKGSWLTPRDEDVEAKGKGIMHTFWVAPITQSSSCGSRTSNSNSASTEVEFDVEQMNLAFPQRRHLPDLTATQQRLIGWTVELLTKLLKSIIAKRQTEERNGLKRSSSADSDIDEDNNSAGSLQPRDEYAEYIKMPTLDLKSLVNAVEPESIKLDEKVSMQLRDFVTMIACSYRDNHFHNFEHAAHVTMSVNKLLRRIVQAEDCDRSKDTLDNIASHLHNYTYGITSDPLTHFACVFAAMVHDVDHAGVGNQQLVQEKDELAALYDNKSVLEQNSIDIAWQLLMDPAYEALQATIYTNEKEKAHFRSLLVNLVMATDIFDPSLMKMRNSRWQKAFHEDTKDDRSDLKATIVIEHIIQASDVAHTMQHWHVYQKWNKRFFQEQYQAYREGRMDKNPAEGWYKGELWFYDNYILPLAQKLKDCAVFGVASDEFLTYALDNRAEWKEKGEATVAEMERYVLAMEQAADVGEPGDVIPKVDSVVDMGEASNAMPSTRAEDSIVNGLGV